MTLIDRLAEGPKAWVLLFLITWLAALPGVFLLPPLDRDESRFAQASKEMLEEDNYILIQYQDELRNKKPAGIHWMQAATTAMTTGVEAREIWTYRLPSLIGACFATLATFWAGIVLIGRRGAFLGAALFGSTLLLTSEAHISKTDGMLVFLTTLSIGALARLYLHRAQSKAMALIFWIAVSVSFLIKGPVTLLVAAFAGLGVFVWDRASSGRGGDWWRVLLWWPGPLIFVALVLPWFTWIQLATDGQYVKGAVGKDLKEKFSGASEGHAGWPLYHLTHLPAWFFPATLLILPGLTAAWTDLRGTTQVGRKRGTDALLITLALAGLVSLVAWALPMLGFRILPAYPALILLVFAGLSTRNSWLQRWPTAPETATTPRAGALRFIVAWAVLTTLFFELMPTRLSHYILPAYPAFGLLCGYAADKMIRERSFSRAAFISLLLFLLGAAALIAVSHPALINVGGMQEAAGDFTTALPADVLERWTPQLGFPLWLWVVAIALIAGTAFAFLLRRTGAAVMLSVLAAISIGWHIRVYMLPSQTWIQATVTAAEALRDVCGVPGEPCARAAPSRVLALGYAEPSYVFALGTQNLHPPETPLVLPEDKTAYPIVYLVNYEDRRADPGIETQVQQLKADADAKRLCIEEGASHYALNYSNGDPVHFRALRIEACGAR